MSWVCADGTVVTIYMSTSDQVGQLVPSQWSPSRPSIPGCLLEAYPFAWTDICLPLVAIYCINCFLRLALRHGLLESRP